MAEFILGIEGGGTALSGCLLRGDGVILACAQAEPVIYAQVRGGISQPILQLLRRLQQQAQLPPQPVDFAGVCSTGIGRATDRQIVSEALAAVNLARHLTVDSDAMSALTGAFAGAPGIIVAAGTGSFAFARTGEGQFVRVGGWGYLLGDEGSGFALARNAINAALQDWDGRGEATSLRRVFERHFEVESIELSISKIYQPGFDRGHMAKLAPLVFAEAEAGDAVAQRLIAETGFALGLHARAALARFHTQQTIPLALLGGLFHRRELLLPSFWQALGAAQARLRLVEPRFPPVIGGALLALLQAGRTLDETFLGRLEQSRRHFNI
ncbi:MAG: hypothetical protein ONB48_21505 [candidate division KSB1 bacterium]|nr:hypothetical protein [candidate division KSB1 bacterium]MDZ7274858.1 hypothetical protein [candidate division KSB1 bacterium]MDZ7288225.1 hypothetical protein [candidate division KSB1 bacterium]MDZ7300394.1 hypothetical protein [candidate division KSB1 bacterium]MDZ7308769.1 hypothetical protein [candidate division KSB1 bacterium]